MVVLAVLGGLSLFEATQPHKGLLYLGLAMAGLLIAMTWEGPQVRPLYPRSVEEV
jgi:hypothetical protein